MSRLIASGRRVRRCIAGVVALFLVGPVAADDRTPKLLVVLVVDQMRADYIEAYGHQWTQGLRQLLDEGAWFREAAYPYRSTLTCAGHATIATGSFPSAHGMINNNWWDRTLAQLVSCTTDPTAAPISYGGSAREYHSPGTLERPTLADGLRRQAPGRARVVSLSLKPRSTIPLAGRQADAAVWFDFANTWATSTAYTSAPVEPVRRFIDTNPIETELETVWTRLLPAVAYLHDDEAQGEQPPASWDRTFPHPLGSVGPSEIPDTTLDRPHPSFYTQWRHSPFSDAYLAEMAVALVEAFELGAGEDTDYLAIGFSALDYVGHRFGPESHEVQDVLARLDVALGSMLEALDARVGRDEYIVALSSDHGVSAIPDRETTRGVDAGWIATAELVRRLETLLTEQRGPGPHVAAIQNGDVYFAPGVYAELRDHPTDLEAVIELIADTPGVWRVFADDQLRAGAPEGDRLTRAAKLSYFPGRSGDIVFIPRPNWIQRGLAATHGSPHQYDTHVPVILFGAGIQPGEHRTAVTPADIAPTLAYVAGITLPQPDGRVLTEALVPTRAGRD